MKKSVYCLFIFFLWISYCEAREQLEIVDEGKVTLSAFAAGTVEAHSKVEQNQYDSSRISTRRDTKGTISLEGNGATPLNYSEVLRIDSDGLIYCTITLWHTPYKEKDSRITITRTIINDSVTDYEFPDWSGLEVEWFLFKKVKK
ncbi:MAG: hypothetical protein Q6358_02620 [Candidatus Brocadiales bacterium]|nr:hypothetical protein [Candidatus Brocadiales bacterium]